MSTASLPPAYAQAFAACMQNALFGRLAKEILAQPGGAAEFLQATLPAINHDPSRLADNVKTVSESLYKRQAARIDDYLGPCGRGPRIGFLCPSQAYRQTFGDADTRLRARGARAVKLFGMYMDDDFERSEGAFFAGFDIPTRIANLDLLFIATFIDQPTTAPRFLFVHDIFDSPLGDEEYFRRHARTCAGFFMPSTLGVESMQRVFAPIARPDDPAAGGNRHVIIRGGYPRLDHNIAYFKQHAVEEKTIVYAPTVPLPEFADYVSVPRWVGSIVETLIERFPDHRLIFRPHPHSMANAEVNAVIARFERHPRFEVDLEGSHYMPSYARAAVMVSDTSGTTYTYAFTTGRPVVFFSPNDREARARNPGVRYFEFRERVGLVAENIESLVGAVTTALATPARFRESSFRLRDEIVFNVGHASEYFASIFDHLVDGTDIPGAIYFRA